MDGSAWFLQSSLQIDEVEGVWVDMTCADGFSLFTHSTSTCTLICRVLWHNPHHHCHKIFSSKQAAPPRRPATTDLACLAASADPPCLFRAGHLSPTVGAAPGSMLDADRHPLPGRAGCQGGEERRLLHATRRPTPGDTVEKEGRPRQAPRRDRHAMRLAETP